jgi:general secretion pathway protein A
LGQPELRRILSTQIYEAIVQRLNLRFHLPGMSLEETKGYIAHHLHVAGAANARSLLSRQGQCFASAGHLS